jgi:hypothetical protein
MCIDLPKDLRDQLRSGSCPNCGGKEFLAGPSGGECQNIECKDCGCDFNVGPMAAQLIGFNNSGRWKVA